MHSRAGLKQSSLAEQYHIIFVRLGAKEYVKCLFVLPELCIPSCT